MDGVSDGGHNPPAAGNSRRAGIYLLVTVALLALAGVGLAWVVTATSAPADSGRSGAGAGSTARGTQHYGHAPSYRLIDQNGRPLSSSALRGKVQVVSYLFPYCTSYCPLITRNLKLTEDLARHAGLGEQVSFVGFNVDPAGSGPAQMRAFLSEYGISPHDPDWHFLTGRPKQVRRVVTGGFHIYYRRVSFAKENREMRRQKRNGTYHPQPDAPNAVAKKANVDYDIVHNDSIEVVDPTGRITGYFANGDKVSPQRLLAAVRRAAG
jgi:cytochrome oxidase Cu insertion factor (SCO1/SenC/PrrC family)